MKICQDHWDMLRAQIENLGLMHLVAGNEAELMEIIRGDGFEPLWMANNLIWQNALESGIDETDRRFCPLCESDSADQWIQGATTDVLNEARRRNLVPQIQ